MFIKWSYRSSQLCWLRKVRIFWAYTPKSPFLFVNYYHWFLYEVYGIRFIQTCVVIHICIASIMHGGWQLKIEEVSMRCSLVMRRFWSCDFECYNNISYWWQHSSIKRRNYNISGKIFLTSQSFWSEDIPWERHIVSCFSTNWLEYVGIG